MNSVINVRKVSFDFSKGYIHQLNYTSGSTYHDIMSKVANVCRTHHKGQIVMVNTDLISGYVADVVPQLNVIHLSHLYDPRRCVADIRTHVRNILDNGNDEIFVIRYKLVVIKEPQRLYQQVRLTGGSK